jgi:probable rRNA maturation factor
MPVRLSIEKGPHEGLEPAEIRRRLRVLTRALAISGAELSVLLTDDEHIHELNRDYRSVDRPTDVLAFAMREGEMGDVASGVLGDVVVSVETARRQAAGSRRHVLEEVTMLLTHGVLHLLGWDHETAAKDRKMRRETSRLMALARAQPAARPPRSRAR